MSRPIFVLTLSIITHQHVLRLFDEEGLSILSQLHVQTHWLSVDLYVHLQERLLFSNFRFCNREQAL